MTRYAVIGAGIVGAALARALVRRFPGARVSVFDKESGPARHQSGHNSGVVHAGLYYRPGSLKARLCRRGATLVAEYARRHGLPFERCGKVVVALDPSEVERLQDIYDTARANGVPGVRLVEGAALRAIEPGVRGALALHSPATAITDYAAIAAHLLGGLDPHRARVRYGARVTAVRPQAGGVALEAGGRTLRYDQAFVCAGIHTDRLARTAGGDRYPRMVPFFGQYREVEPRLRRATRGLVYPVPDPAYPFLGVHITRRVDSALLLGPNAFFSPGRENYTGWRVNVADTLGSVADPGFVRFAAHNLAGAARELRGLASPNAFARAAARYVPALADARTRALPRGIRAQAMNADGSLVDDFVLERLGPVTLVRNAPSPGATSSLALAEHLVDTCALA